MMLHRSLRNSPGCFFLNICFWLVQFLDRKVGRGIRNRTRDLWDISAFQMRVLAHSKTPRTCRRRAGLVPVHWIFVLHLLLKTSFVIFSSSLSLFPHLPLPPFLPLSLSLTFPYFKISIFISSLSSILSARTKTRMTLGYRTCEGCINQPSGLCRHSWCSLGLGNSLAIGSPKEGKPGTLCLISEKHPENTETAIKSDPRSGGWGGGPCFLLSALAEEIEVR